MSVVESIFIALAAIVALAVLVFWLQMIRHCWTHTEPGSRERWVWLLIVVLGKLPGALGYYLLHVRPERVETTA